MPAVKSKMFSAVEFKDGTLTVTMTNGKTYHHDNVPAATHAAMMAAPSLGRFYGEKIKCAHPHRAPKK